MRKSGNTVLITGGSSGIGFALASKFVEAGNRVIIAGRSRRRLDEARERIPALETRQADLTDPESLGALAGAFPEIDVLVNNAGVQFNYDLADEGAPLALVGKELGTNLEGPILLTRMMLPKLLEKPVASIVNVSSGLGLVPKQSAAVYCATKAAMHLFTKALRWQLEGSPVKVFEMIPPIVDTAMTAGRGSGKISPVELVEEFWKDFGRDRYEMLLGKTKLLAFLDRLAPPIAEGIMRKGL